ncbi:hypothetical protein Tco_1320490 [Tanacetum coccineum]
MFDEYLEPPRVERPVPPALAVQVPANSAGTSSSTTIDQDAPSASHSPSSSVLQSPSSHQGVAAGSTIIEDNPFAPVDNDPFVNVFAPEPKSEASSSEDFSSVKSTYVTQPHHHLEIWSKDHPLDNVIGNPSRLRSGGYPPGGRGKNTLEVTSDNPRVSLIPESSDNMFMSEEACSLKQAPWACYDTLVKASPTKKHIEALKRVFQYLRGTINWGLWYPKDTAMALTTYADADHAGCQDTRRSTSGSVQFLGDKLVSWS